MGSKSNSTDKTTDTTVTRVEDRRAIMERGNQILDSVIVDPSDKTLKETVDMFRASFGQLLSNNSVSLIELSRLADRVYERAQNGQIKMQDFAFKALENARDQMLQTLNQGALIVELSDRTTNAAMTMAQRVIQDQAQNQRAALEIVAEAKSGDTTETMKYTLTAVMFFALAVLYMQRDQ